MARITESNRWKVYRSMYRKLMDAIASTQNETDCVASVEVLGTTGSWLSQLTDYELSLMIGQLNAEQQSRHINDDEV